jgi:hypothetical protein
MNTRSQAACAWAGIAGLLLVLVGFVISGYILPPHADLTPQQLTDFYTGNLFGIRLGCLLMMVGFGGYATMLSVVWVQLQRIEGPRSVMAVLGMIGGLTAYVLLVLFVIFLAAAAFRPERSVEITQTLHDVGWFMAFLAAVPFCLQGLGTGLAILGDRSAKPVYPRWVGYGGLWVVVLLLPGDLLLFFHTGPFAYHGLISYWIALFTFGGWMALLSFMALLAAKAEAQGSAGGVTAG